MGMPPMTALQVATINTARHYRLRNFGAIAPRYWADFVVVEDLTQFHVRETYKKGHLVASGGKYLVGGHKPAPPPRSTMNVRYNAPTDFEIENPGRASIRVIELVPNQIITREAIDNAPARDGKILPDVQRDLLKLVVVERHHATGNVGVGFVRGFKLKQGALGSTVAHDAHNVVVVGVSDDEITRAIQALEKMQGGQVVVVQGEVRAALPLPIAGLVSDRPLDEVVQRVADLNAEARAIGCELAAPFMALSFLSLSPIPELKLTDQGLIDSVHLRRTTLLVPSDN